MKYFVVAALLLLSFDAQSQYSRYVLELTDKKGTKHTLSTPQSFLSTESIDRKKRFNIAIDSADMPVSAIYVDSISKMGNLQIIGSSKWMNILLIQTTDAAAIQKINRLGFIKKQSPIANSIPKPKQIEKIKFSHCPIHSTQLKKRMKIRSIMERARVKLPFTMEHICTTKV